MNVKKNIVYSFDSTNYITGKTKLLYKWLTAFDRLHHSVSFLILYQNKWFQKKPKNYRFGFSFGKNI